MVFTRAERTNLILWGNRHEFYPLSSHSTPPLEARTKQLGITNIFWRRNVGKYKSNYVISQNHAKLKIFVTQLSDKVIIIKNRYIQFSQHLNINRRFNFQLIPPSPTHQMNQKWIFVIIREIKYWHGRTPIKLDVMSQYYLTFYTSDRKKATCSSTLQYERAMSF